MTTDNLAEVLPPYVIHENEVYSMKITKHSTKHRWCMEYKNKTKNLGNTYRSGETIYEAIENMIDFLIEFKYLKEPDNILQQMIDMKNR